MKQRIIMLRLMFIVYLYVLIRIILFKFHEINMMYLLQQLKLVWINPERIIWRMKQGNLVPFEEISTSLQALSSHGMINLVGNVAIFIPFGILQGLMRANNKISLMEVLIRSFGASLCLECAQAIFSIGSFDVDDLILNTSGGVIGFLAFSMYNKFMRTEPYPIQTRTDLI